MLLPPRLVVGVGPGTLARSVASAYPQTEGQAVRPTAPTRGPPPGPTAAGDGPTGRGA